MLFGRAFELALGAYFRREDPERSCFANGLPASIRNCSSRTMTPGTGCSSKESCCLFVSVRTIGSDCATAPQSANQVHAASRNERVHRLRRCNRNTGWEAMLLEWKTSSSRYAEEPDGVLALDPQTGLLFLDHRHCRGRSGRLRAQAPGRGPVFANNHQRRAAPGVRPSGREHDCAESNRPTSCPTAVSGSLRIRAAVAHTSAFVWGGKTWSEPVWFADQERKTLVGLTSLITEEPAHAAETQSRARPVRAGQDR